MYAGTDNLMFPLATQDRRGTVNPLILILFLTGLILLTFVLDFLTIQQMSLGLSSASDAAALAAASTLMDDRALLNHPGLIAALYQDSQAEGRRYAVLNAPQGGRGFTIDSSNSIHVQLESSGNPDPMLLLPDRCRVTMYRTRATGNPVSLLLAPWLVSETVDIARQSLASIERQIIGFDATLNIAIPLAPIGILTDNSQQRPDAWESQLAAGLTDDSAYDRISGQFFSHQADGLPELSFELSTNCWPLAIGSHSSPESQLLNGVVQRDLIDFGGSLILSATGPNLDLMNLDVDHRASLVQGLNGLWQSAEARIWPLAQTPAIDGLQAKITGFIAARVVRIEAGTTPTPPTLTPSPSVNPSLRIVLQPTVMCTTTAVSSPMTPEVPLNPFIARIRLTR